MVEITPICQCQLGANLRRVALGEMKKPAHKHTNLLGVPAHTTSIRKLSK
jgi:hypothetical protein